jgi:DNA-binding NtrC family response regulator
LGTQHDTLLTFVGSRDPCALGTVEGVEQPGPVLTLLRERQFQRIVLFSTPAMYENAERTRDALRAAHGELDIALLPLAIDDPTDYAAIFRELKPVLQDMAKKQPLRRYWVSVNSGTPQMHACWLMLVQSGALRARILQVRAADLASGVTAAVTEWDDLPELARTAPSISESRSFGIVFREPKWSCQDEPQEEPDHVVLSRDLESARASRTPRRTRAAQTIPATLPPVRPALESLRLKLGIIGDHPALMEVLERAEVAAPTDMAVLITGETGTGKDLIARLVHRLSDRSDKPFVPLNCGAIARELVESTLFGHARGAFTGAIRDHQGKFEEAHGGTLFLDELGDLPLDVQVKLLRVIEDGVIQRVGSPHTTTVDVRIVAATHRDLREGIEAGTFREDLYYRITVVELNIPPLHERPTDIPKLAAHLMEGINAQIAAPKRLSPDALARLEGYRWPGNVRGLRNALTRSAISCRGEVIDADGLILGDARSVSNDPLDHLPKPCEGFDLNGYLKSVRKRLFLLALELAGGNQSQAARLLGVSPQAVSSFQHGPDD